MTHQFWWVFFCNTPSGNLKCCVSMPEEEEINKLQSNHTPIQQKQMNLSNRNYFNLLL